MAEVYKISVIVPVYQVETVLKRCLDSILNQSYRNFEVLLIDDGSLDMSRTICDQYAATDSRVRVFHQTNQGVSATRNYGLEQATGDYIVFIDSDDWVESEFFATLSHSFGEYDILFFGGKILSSEGEEIGLFTPPAMQTPQDSVASIVYSLSCSGILGYMWSMSIKRTLLMDSDIRFRRDISLHEDSIFCYNSLKVTSQVISLSITPYRYLVYQKGRNTLSSRIPDNYYEIVLTRISEMQILQDALHMPAKQRKHILDLLKYWAYSKFMDRAYKQPDPLRAIRECFGKLSAIEDFDPYSVKAWLFRWTIRLKSPSLMLFCKRLSGMV